MYTTGCVQPNNIKESKTQASKANLLFEAHFGLRSSHAHSRRRSSHDYSRPNNSSRPFLYTCQTMHIQGLIHAYLFFFSHEGIRGDIPSWRSTHAWLISTVRMIYANTSANSEGKIGPAQHLGPHFYANSIQLNHQIRHFTKIKNKKINAIYFQFITPLNCNSMNNFSRENTIITASNSFNIFHSKHLIISTLIF